MDDRFFFLSHFRNENDPFKRILSRFLEKNTSTDEHTARVKRNNEVVRIIGGQQPIGNVKNDFSSAPFRSVCQSSWTSTAEQGAGYSDHWLFTIGRDLGVMK